MARKREERAVRSSQRAAKKASQNGSQDSNFVSLKQQLVAMGLTLREITGDGNCLFRALGDQLDGTTTTHLKHRHLVVEYMRQHRDDFEPFVEDDVPFERHCNNLAQLGTYAGNDCIVAFARLHQVSVVIHQLNTPRWEIKGTEGKKNVMELHISYHNGDHYNSVRRLGDCSSSPASVKLTTIALPIASAAAPKLAAISTLENGVDEEGEDDEDEYEDENPRDNSFNGHHHHHHHLPSISSGQEGLSRVEQEVMDQTGCEDLALVREFLCANDYEVRMAADELINYIIHQHKGEHSQTLPGCTNGLLSSPEGSTTSWVVGGGASACHGSQSRLSPQEKINQRLKSQQHISNSKRKELKKQLRKHEANERKRHRQAGVEPDTCAASESEILVHIGCLSI